MRIALYHNLGPGGGKRHLFEHARLLQARGHRLDLFVPVGANENFLPLAPLCGNVYWYGASGGESPIPAAAPPSGAGGSRADTLRRAARMVLGQTGHDLLAEAVWARRVRARGMWLEVINREIARAIDGGGYDVAYIHQCAITLAPDLLRFLQITPTVFMCNDTPRWAYEWALDGPADYDALPDGRLRRKRLGKLWSPIRRALADAADRRFVANTRAAKRVLSISRFGRECIVRATGVNPRVCYPGVDTDYFAPRATPKPYLPDTDEAAPIVLSVGAMLPNKQHEFILRAMGAIPPQRRPRLEIVGYESPLPGDPEGVGPEGARLQTLARSLGVPLRLRRDVSEDVLRDAYRRAAVVAVAPYLEPFGLVALEAMACGIPVVGVAEGGVRETVQEDVTGLLTDRESEAFAAALDRVLSDPALARRLGEAGRNAARTQWTWDRSVDTAEAILFQAARVA